MPLSLPNKYSKHVSVIRERNETSLPTTPPQVKEEGRERKHLPLTSMKMKIYTSEERKPVEEEEVSMKPSWRKGVFPVVCPVVPPYERRRGRKKNF